jgi:DNA-binding beta-propeller fold protein YncE
MTSSEWSEGPPAAPEGGKSRWSNPLKVGILVLILIALGWILLIIGQYCSTGKPISELPAVPGVDDLFDDSSFSYVGSIEGIQNPMGVAVGLDGRVYVTETGGEQKVRIYDSLGKQELGSFRAPGADTEDRIPMYVAVNPNSGDVYVSDRAVSRIFIFSPDGEPKGELAPPEGIANWSPLALAFDEAGNMYISDVTADKHQIIVLDPDGKLKLNFGTQGEKQGEFWFPNGIVVDDEGRMFISDSNNGRMQAFDKDGKFLFAIGRGMSKGDLAMPRGIAFDTQDRLLILDTTRGSIQAYSVKDSNGDEDEPPAKYQGVFYGDSARRISFLYPNGMAVDGKNKVYIADRGNNRVSIWQY